jgi:glycosyltransferase involved in cell wall biosynthesis
MRVSLYAHVDDSSLFRIIGFYRDDIAALSLGGHAVSPTNSVFQVVRSNPDVLIGYFYSYSLIPAILTKLRGRRVVLTGGADSIAPGLSNGRALRFRQFSAIGCAIFADRVVVPCESDEAHFRALVARSSHLSKKIHRAPHVVNLPSTAAAKWSPQPGRFSAFTICWMGTVANAIRKGVDRAVMLIAGLAASGTDATLTIAGVGGPGWVHIQELAKSLGVQSRIEFVGCVSEAKKLEYLQSSDAYLQLSRHEGFGVAAAEALCIGIPVVHTGKGGLRDAIGDGGIVVSDDVDDYFDPTWISRFLDTYSSFTPDWSLICQKRDEFSFASRCRALLQ